MGADTTAIEKHERNPMNMTTTVGKTSLKKETGGKCFFEPRGFLPIQ